MGLSAVKKSNIAKTFNRLNNNNKKQALFAGPYKYIQYCKSYL